MVGEHQLSIGSKSLESLISRFMNEIKCGEMTQELGVCTGEAGARKEGSIYEQRGTIISKQGVFEREVSTSSSAPYLRCRGLVAPGQPSPGGTPPTGGAFMGLLLPQTHFRDQSAASAWVLIWGSGVVLRCVSSPKFPFLPSKWTPASQGGSQWSRGQS